MRMGRLHRSATLLIALGFVTLLQIGRPAAQPAGGDCTAGALGPQSVQITVRYQGEPPSKVRIESASRRDICLRPDPDGLRFFGGYPTPSPPRLFVANVVAEFRDGRTTSVPLDLGYRNEPLSFTLPRPQSGPCLRGAVQRMLGEAGSRDAALAAAYQARLWYRATTGCPLSLKSDVARAWFDRSYEAVEREHAFRLDLEAARALSREPEEDEGQQRANQQYVRERLGQYARLEAIKRRDLQLALGEGGFALDAISMVAAIDAAMETDSASAAIYRREGVTRELLANDRNFYINRSGVDRTAAGIIAARAAPDSAAIPFILMEGIQREGGPRNR